MIRTTRSTIPVNTVGPSARLEAEVAALRLLSRTLNAAEEKTRAQYFEPVTRRLVPYLARVIPEAQPSFSEGFTLQGLIRAGQREEFQALSDGTREQLSVLVRMAFARLIADSGEAAPLVLDDPLVYSDDTEMLGNWSFGDYFKKEALAWSWELLTEVYGLEKDRLYATVFEGDTHENLEEHTAAYQIWLNYLPKTQILFGNKKDNFWEMGAQGPCGPC